MTFRKRYMGMFLLAAFIVAALLVSTVAFTVDELKDIVIVKTFGRVTATYRGREDAGFHWKWPWPIQMLVRYDSRTFTLEDPYAELQTVDAQNILITSYCTWRIKDPVRFLSSIETIKKANESVRERLRDHKNTVVRSHMLEEFINTDPAKMNIRGIEQEILKPLREQMAAEYGVEVRSVGVKLLGLPEAVSEIVIEAQKEERQRDVQELEAAGEAQATAIRARAERASKQILAFAKAKAMKIQAEGDSAAARYYSEYAKNEAFAMFLRALESLKKELKSKTTILLDGSQVPGMDWFRKGPSLPKADLPAVANPAAGGETQRSPQARPDK